MNKRFYIFTFLLSILLASCTDNSRNKTNLTGLVYRDLKEIKSLDGFMEMSSSIIENKTGTHTDEEFALVHLADTIKNLHIVMFERIVPDSKDSSKANFCILDTIHVKSTSKNDRLLVCQCFIDSISRPEIIALVDGKIEEGYYKKIKQVWKADIVTSKIKQIGNLTALYCIEPGFEGD